MFNFLKYFWFVVIFSQANYAQMYLASGGVVYVKNEVLFINQQLELTANSNLYLRNEAQLLQGTSGTSANKGTGILSLYQEGRATQFTYNYWCSPVGSASSATGNENFGISMLGRPVSNILSTPANVNSPTIDGSANPLVIANSWIYKYLSSDSPTAWIPVGNATIIAPGQGFTMKGTAGTDTTIVEGNSVQNNPGGAQRYAFTGKPNDGNITAGLATLKYTLTGNPYPSALHLNAFLLDPGNVASTGIAYFWEQDQSVQSHYLADYKGGYGAYSPVSLNSAGIYVPATFNTYNSDGTLNATGTSSNLNIARKYSPIGQGFMLVGASDGTVTFKNSHRAFYKESTTPQSFFNRPDATNYTENSDSTDYEMPVIRFNVSINDASTRQLVLAFPEYSTSGVDFGIDAIMIDSGKWPNDVFFSLDNSNYVIQGLSFDISVHIPLRIYSAGQTTFYLSVAELLNFPESQPIFLYDSLLNTYHDISDSGLELLLSEGEYIDRFEIRFENTELATDELNLSSFDVIHDNDAKILKILNKNRVFIDHISIYDIAGKQVGVEGMVGNYTTAELSTAGLSDGVYVVRISSGKRQATTRKFIVRP